MSRDHKVKVLIVGGGIVGLLLAQTLKKNNIHFTVVEAEESVNFYRPREWGMSIQWALPLLEQLLPHHLLARLQTTSVDPHHVIPENGTFMPVYNATTGELIKKVPIVRMLRVSRRKLRALCAEGIDIQYSKRVKEIRTSPINVQPEAVFEDGTSEVADLVIAADGANSAVRQSVFQGQDGIAERIPYAGVNMHVCYQDALVAQGIRKSLSPIFGMGSHPKGYWLWLSVQDVPQPDKPADWTFQLQWTWEINPNNESLNSLNLDTLKAEAATFAEPFRTAWTKIPAGSRVTANRISVWQPQAIPNGPLKGKVALLGDAAHAMSFHRGQGLNHGIADVQKMCDLLYAVEKGEKKLDIAVKEYEEDMVKRAGEEVTIGKMNTEMLHDWERLMNSPFMQRGGDKNK